LNQNPNNPSSKLVLLGPLCKDKKIIGKAAKETKRLKTAKTTKQE